MRNLLTFKINPLPLLLSMLLLMGLCLFPMTRLLAQSAESSQESSPIELTPGTTSVIPSDATGGSTVYLPSPTPSALETAQANFINNFPLYLVMAGLFALIAYLLVERSRLTHLLANFMPIDMAKTWVDGALKTLLQMGYSVAAQTETTFDNEALDSLTQKAGLRRTINPDGSVTWLDVGQPVAQVTSSPDGFLVQAKAAGFNVHKVGDEYVLSLSQPAQAANPATSASVPG